MLGFFSSRPNWDTTPPHPLTRRRKCSPRLVPGGGHTRLRVGGSQFVLGDKHCGSGIMYFVRKTVQNKSKSWKMNLTKKEPRNTASSFYSMYSNRGRKELFPIILRTKTSFTSCRRILIRCKSSLEKKYHQSISTNVTSKTNMLINMIPA